VNSREIPEDIEFSRRLIDALCLPSEPKVTGSTPVGRIDRKPCRDWDFRIAAQEERSANLAGIVGTHTRALGMEAVPMVHPLRVPKLRFHAPTKQHYIYLGKGQGRKYFGRDLVEAERQYGIWKARHILAGPGAAPAIQAGDQTITVSEAVVAYLRHADNYYRDPRDINRVGHAMAVVMDEFGALPVGEFKSKALKHIQAKLIERPVMRRFKAGTKATATKISRKYANKLLVDVVHCWQWLVSEEVVPPENLHAMETVTLIHLGRGGRETPRVPPVAPEVVEATLAYCPSLLATMIQVQRLTGMRPGELCRMRRCDISLHPKERLSMPGMEDWRVSAMESGAVLCWVYAPSKHKNLHRGQPRAVLIGPRAQELLRPLLDGRTGEDHIFVPRESMQAWRAIQRESRKTRVQPSQKNRAKRHPRKGAGDLYPVNSYAQAVERAIARANKARAKEGLELLPKWRPNQLRHSAATSASERFDETHAAAMLGHAGLDAVRIYAEQALGKAAKTAAELG